MKYAQLRKLDISNGEGIGVALFVQGCHFHCKNCFNPQTWDFSGGQEFTKEVEERLFSYLDNKHVSRFTLLGGEPLAPENRDSCTKLLKKIREETDKKVWLYTGYTYEEIKDLEILKYVDVLVDGRYVDELRDINLEFRGSSNQRLIKLGLDK